MGPRRVYRISVVAVLLVAALAPPAAPQVELDAHPSMTKGPADAPVTIVEFSDYQ